MLDALTPFDIHAITKCAPLGLDCLYLSFTNTVDDILEVKNLLKKTCKGKQSPKIIAKIESRLGIANLEKIILEVDGILIDRGDLSREISISRIPIATNAIINLCNENNVPCFVATNVLDSMLSNPLPSRAEISDLYNLYKIGVSGIVLAAEVAIGECSHTHIRPAVLMMHVYRRLLGGLIARGWKRLHEPVKVSKLIKLWILLRYGLL